MKIDTGYFQTIPATDAPKTGWISLPSADLQRALHRVVCAASKDETRAHINAVYLHSDDGKGARVVATDGHRVHLARIAYEGAPFKALLPFLTARVLEGALALPEATSCEMAIGLGAFFRIGSDVYRAKLVDALFPPYQQIFSPVEQITRRAVVQRRPLREALKLIARVHPLGYWSAIAGVDIGERVVITCGGEEVLPFRANAGARLGGDALKLHITARSFITALRVVGGEEVRFSRTADDLDPILLTPANEDEQSASITALVMPCRV